MKLISLNIWGGKQNKQLLDFIGQHSKDTDIFCFQEVYNGTNTDIVGVFGGMPDIHHQIKNILPGFRDVHNEVYEFFFDRKFTAPFGLSIFVNPKTEIIDLGITDFFSQAEEWLKEGVTVWNRWLQYAIIKNNGKEYVICNLHGLHTGGGKKDIPARIFQSEKVLEFIGKQDCEAVLIGDLNLDMDTESVNILEKKLKNLIKEYGIKTTRSDLYPRKAEMPLADYCFVTSDIKVDSFEVPTGDMSDHLPLILEFK
jgi:hypothetical protein